MAEWKRSNRAQFRTLARGRHLRFCSNRALFSLSFSQQSREKTDSRPFVFEPLLGQYWLLSCAPRALLQHHMPNPLTHSADEWPLSKGEVFRRTPAQQIENNVWKTASNHRHNAFIKQIISSSYYCRLGIQEKEIRLTVLKENQLKIIVPFNYSYRLIQTKELNN